MDDHIPGPWKLCYDGQIDGPNGETVCRFDWSSFSEFNNSPVKKGTARLIKAAPEAMAACIELIRGDGGPDSQQRAIDLARAAIARAEGK